MSQPGGSGPRRSPSRQLALGGLLLVLVLAILLGLGVVVQGSDRKSVV
jgi:hypothetical protein